MLLESIWSCGWLTGLSVTLPRASSQIQVEDVATHTLEQASRHSLGSSITHKGHFSPMQTPEVANRIRLTREEGVSLDTLRSRSGGLGNRAEVLGASRSGQVKPRTIASSYIGRN